MVITLDELKDGVKVGEKEYKVFLEDDGTLDTVISVNGHTVTFSQEYASQFRERSGAMTNHGFKVLALEAIEDYEDFKETDNFD